MKLDEKIAELKKRDQLAQEGGGAQRRERQHKEGKMSARERIEFLLDEGTFRGDGQTGHASLPQLRHGRAEILW
jgi:acetyl-CoA carboxylase carboxyltransferase component